MLETQIAETLSLVNVARQAFGKDILTELPDSKPGDSADCLYYRALVDCGARGVDGYGGITFDDERKASYIGSIWGARVDGCKVKAPAQFRQVIEKFDHSELPHYNDQQKRDF
jgi:hypothetical protein